MLLIRDIDNHSLVLTYTRVYTGCQCNYELTLKTRFWPKAKRRPYFSSYFKVSSDLFFSCFLCQIKIIIIKKQEALCVPYLPSVYSGLLMQVEQMVITSKRYFHYQPSKTFPFNEISGNCLRFQNLKMFFKRASVIEEKNLTGSSTEHRGSD